MRRIPYQERCHRIWKQHQNFRWTKNSHAFRRPVLCRFLPRILYSNSFKGVTFFDTFKSRRKCNLILPSRTYYIWQNIYIYIFFFLDVKRYLEKEIKLQTPFITKCETSQKESFRGVTGAFRGVTGGISPRSIGTLYFSTVPESINTLLLPAVFGANAEVTCAKCYITGCSIFDVDVQIYIYI